MSTTAPTRLWLVIHWVGGRHSELRIAKFKTGDIVVAPISIPSTLCGKWRRIIRTLKLLAR